MAGLAGMFTPPKRQFVDPGKDIKALKDQVRAGLLSMPDALAQSGQGVDELLDEQAEFNAKIDAKGLVFDTDGRRVTANSFAEDFCYS